MSTSVYDALSRWARRTTSSFAELRFLAPHREEPQANGEPLVYRLKHWPDLPPAHRTANVYRALSVMSSRPVNRQWVVGHSRMQAQQFDSLVELLVAQDAVEVFDVSRYASNRTSE